jgi:glycosyltransferase involved in cell wall biosynthesis
MRVMVLGLRGFPGIQGGVETHAEHLYPELRDLGCDIEVLVRSPYWKGDVTRGVDGIRFTPLWCPASTGAEAFVHSFLGALYAARHRPDVLHVHAVGPAMFTPLARLFGVRVVVTHHGPDYDREKWSRAAKSILKTGESLGMRFSNARIVISDVIGRLVRDKYGRDSVNIPNGVRIPDPVETAETPRALGLEPGRYIVTVSRMVPEKRHLDLIAAFRKAELGDWKLALVGDASRNDSYTRQVAAAAAETPGVVMAGFQTGRALAELYANAGLFALPSTHEGLPIALLEALSYGLPSIASDIPANVEVGLPREQYFRVKDVDDLASCLSRNIGTARAADYRDNLQAWVREKYDWHQIAHDTREVYRQVSGKA